MELLRCWLLFLLPHLFAWRSIIWAGRHQDGRGGAVGAGWCKWNSRAKAQRITRHSLAVLPRNNNTVSFTSNSVSLIYFAILTQLKQRIHLPCMHPISSHAPRLLLSSHASISTSFGIPRSFHLSHPSQAASTSPVSGTVTATYSHQ